ncbi:hypothetical protein Tco_1214376 [Tanacetum coccineum]
MRPSQSHKERRKRPESPRTPSGSPPPPPPPPPPSPGAFGAPEAPGASGSSQMPPPPPPSSINNKAVGLQVRPRLRPQHNNPWLDLHLTLENNKYGEGVVIFCFCVHFSPISYSLSYLYSSHGGYHDHIIDAPMDDTIVAM